MIQKVVIWTVVISGRKVLSEVGGVWILAYRKEWVIEDERYLEDVQLESSDMRSAMWNMELLCGQTLLIVYTETCFHVI